MCQFQREDLLRQEHPDGVIYGKLVLHLPGFALNAKVQSYLTRLVLLVDTIKEEKLLNLWKKEKRKRKKNKLWIRQKKMSE